MKVRLKRRVRDLTPLELYRFQFHEGPIKTFLIIVLLGFSMLFQFHEGPIKTCEFCKSVSRGLLFQFHEGPIKTSRAGFNTA